MSKTRLEKFAELNLKLHKLVSAANDEFRVKGMTELYFLKVNKRTMGEVMQGLKNADRAEMVGDVLHPNASTAVH